MKYYKRRAEKSLNEGMKYFPVILITGARQVGKTTFVLEQSGIENYYTLDDINIYNSARKDPDTFIKNISKPVIIDEVQKIPELIIAIKKYVDENRKNGMFVLTGSANLSAFMQVSDTLAGRLYIIDLYPLSQSELYKKTKDFIQELIDFDKFSWRPFNDLEMNIIDGGYPEIRKLQEKRGKYLWFVSYERTYIERDIRDIINIRNVDGFLNFYRLLSYRSSNVINRADLSRKAKIDMKTLNNYITSLKLSYQIFELRPWHKNPTRQYVKKSKIFFTDSGILSNIFGVDSPEKFGKSDYKGILLETFILGEILRSISVIGKRVELYYYRTVKGIEVDFVLETEDQLIGIEVKNSSKVSESDIRGLKSLLEDNRHKQGKGFILYRGDKILPFGKDIFALPI